MTEYAELLGRSCFSFLEGASHPEELVGRAKALGLRAIALCDRDGLYGSARMHVAAKEVEQPVIVGSMLTLEPATDEGAGRPEASGARALRASPALALLAESHDGYAALCRLLTQAHRDHPKGEAGIDLGRVTEDSAGLFALLPLEPSAPPADAELERLRASFGERIALAVWRHLEPDDTARMRLATRLERRFGIPVVASARPLYHDRTRKPLADVLYCIRHKLTLDAAGAALGRNAEAELKGAAAMARLFASKPAWIARSLAIAERCRFTLDELHYRFPCDAPSSTEATAEEPTAGASMLARRSPDARLRHEVMAGCRWRYPAGVPHAVAQQIERELGIIAELAVAPYFLSVKEIVDLARARGILCQGRGSAANSAVCFVLGVTSVDPARSSLLFERFISPERREPPDIDVDFEHERREEVIQAIYQRYGRDRAAMVSEVIRYRPKSALREVSKVFGLSEDQADRLSGAVSYHGWSERSTGQHPELVGRLPADALRRRGLDPTDGRLRRLLELAHELEGLPRHLSIHVGGFVLSAEPLDRVAPIEPARMAGRTVIPWDKDDLDALGFFKVDVLGLGMLTAIRKALALVHEGRPGVARAASGAFDPIAALGRIPPEDPAVYDAICRADTVGLFQIESRAQMAMLPLLRPRCFYDLVVEVGIVRPGPIQGKMVHPYLRRRTGEEAITYPHRCLVPILERTLGVPLFQEQVMQIAIVGAGYSGGEADRLRRDMAAWRRHGRLVQHRDKLLRGFAERGIAPEFGERLYRQIQGFGEYGFPESHAASFALLVYASGWLKVHEPAAFACALLNSQPMGFYSPSSIVRDVQKPRYGQPGVEARPVRIEQSDWDCTLEPGPGGKPALRLGLRLVRGLSQAGAERIAEARRARGGRFASIDDFVQSAALRRDELDRLAEAGALEGITASRRDALWHLRAPRGDALFGGHAFEPEEPVGLPALEAAEQLALDYRTVGLSLHDHPMRHLRPRLGRRRLRRAEEQSGFRPGAVITVAGVVISRQRPMTASGIVFVTLEDETGILNLVVYPHVVERYELELRHAMILLARGRVDRRGEVVHLRVSQLERLDRPGSALALRSRDFH